MAVLLNAWQPIWSAAKAAVSAFNASSPPAIIHVPPCTANPILKVQGEKTGRICSQELLHIQEIYTGDVYLHMWKCLHKEVDILLCRQSQVLLQTIKVHLRHYDTYSSDNRSTAKHASSGWDRCFAVHHVSLIVIFLPVFTPR